MAKKKTETKQENKEMVRLQNEQVGVLEKAKSLQIVSHETHQEAVNLGKEIKRIFKGFEDLRKFHTAGMKKEIKKIEDGYKPFTSALKSAEGDVKDKVLDYETKLEEERKKEEARLNKEAQEKHQKEVEKAEQTDDTPPPPPAPIHVEAPKIEGQQLRKRWTYDKEKIDIEKVPAVFQGSQLLIVDSKVVQKLIDAGIREIPGLYIYEKASIALEGKEDISDL